MPKHPMQKIVLDDRGVARFEENKIVSWLVDQIPQSLNTIALMNFPREDREQLAMLIGYSVSGAGDLSYFSARRISHADRAVNKLVGRS